MCITYNKTESPLPMDSKYNSIKGLIQLKKKKKEPQCSIHNNNINVPTYLWVRNTHESFLFRKLIKNERNKRQRPEKNINPFAT